MDHYTDEYDDDGSVDTDGSVEFPIATDLNTKKDSRKCVICGGNASGINFNALTCLPCKAFFRRNAFKPLDHMICRMSGKCEINHRSRRHCTACRIRKCFAMDMMKERIRTEAENKRYRELIEGNRKAKSDKVSNQECHESEMIINDYHDDSCLPTNSQINSVNDLHNLFLMTINQYVPKEFVFNFNSDLTEVLNLYCIPVSCFIAYIKQLSHFKFVPLDDRVRLLKNNTKILLPMFACLLKLTRETPFVFNHPGDHNINDKIAYSCFLFSRLIKNDFELLSLIITLFLFCPCLLTNESLINAGYINKQSYKFIKKAADDYTTMLWNYIMKKSYGNEQPAIITYMKIITTITHLQNITNEIYDGIEDYIDIDNLHIMLQSVLHLI